VDAFDFDSYWSALRTTQQRTLESITNQLSHTAKKGVSEADWGGFLFWGFISNYEKSSVEKAEFIDGVRQFLRCKYSTLEAVQKQGLKPINAQIAFCYSAYIHEQAFGIQFPQFLLKFYEYAKRRKSHLVFDEFKIVFDSITPFYPSKKIQKIPLSDLTGNPKNIKKVIEGISQKAVETILNHQLASAKEPSSPNEQLIKSSLNGDKEGMILSISIGADINYQRGFDGSTALHIALENEDKDIIELLMSEGASFHIKDHFGIDALKLIKEKATTLFKHIIHTPLVGIFLRSNQHEFEEEGEICGYSGGWYSWLKPVYNPDITPLIKEGDYVNKGQVLGIICSGLFGIYEVKADVNGFVALTCAEDNSDVTLDQPLFVIVPSEKLS
jgi:biotin carboxyl carrier protein